MAAFDHDAVQVEIAEPGILRARRMARGEPGSGARLVAALGAADDGQARPGQRVGVPGGRLEQQRDARVGEQVFGMLGEVGQQQ